MKKLVDYSIILLTSTVLGLSLLQFFHIFIGVFYQIIPILFITLIVLVVYKFVDRMTYKKTNILIFFLVFLIGCTTEVVNPLDDKESFIKANNLVLTDVKASGQRTFEDFVSFKKYFIATYSKREKKQIVHAVVNVSYKNLYSGGRIEYVPCKTNNYAYVINSAVFDYDGGADLNVNLNYNVNSQGNYANVVINPSQFGNTSDSFSSTTPQITANSATGEITSIFNTTQTVSFNFGFNVSYTTLTQFKITYNPCGTGGGDMRIEYEELY